MFCLVIWGRGPRRDSEQGEPGVFRGGVKAAVGLDHRGFLFLSLSANARVGAVLPDRARRLPSTWQGRDLNLTSGGATAEQPVFAESAPSLRGIVTSEWKYIFDEDFGEELLFHRGEDPTETQDVVEKFQQHRRNPTGKLSEAGARPGAVTGAADHENASPELLEKLKSLGYVH